MRNLTLITILLIAALTAYAVCTTVSAASDEVSRNDEINIDASTFFVAEQDAKSYPYPIYTVNQGDVVFLGDHLDISRVAAGHQALAWFSYGEPTKSSIAYIIDLPLSKYKYYNVYLDPEVFKSKTGWWYKWDGFVEDAGNQNAFKIMPYTRPANVTPIQTINVTLIQQQEETARMPLPEKKVADYLTVHGQYLKVTGKEAPYKVWIFGTKDRIYDKQSQEFDYRFTREQIDTLHTGKYTILIQYRGINTDFDVSWNEEKEELGRTSDNPWEKAELREQAGIQPLMVLETLKTMLDKTDDKYETFSLEIQDPMLQVMGMDLVEVRDARGYYDNKALRGNVSIYRIKGYTNVLPMTGLRFALDEDEQGNVQFFTGEAKETSPGSMRQFKVDIPIYKDEMREGMHTISGYTTVGGSVYYDFPINIAPEHSYIPDQNVKYIGDENPWKPNLTTPTPIIQTVTVTQTVIVNVTPSDEQVREQQAAVMEKINADNWATTWFTVLVFILLIGGGTVIGYIIWVWRRARKQNPWEEAM